MHKNGDLLAIHLILPRPLDQRSRLLLRQNLHLDPAHRPPIQPRLVHRARFIRILTGRTRLRTEAQAVDEDEDAVGAGGDGGWKVGDDVEGVFRGRDGVGEGLLDEAGVRFDGLLER